MPPFVHLHVHTQYSILDGASSIGKLFESAKEDGQRAIAITDHGVMYGVKEFLDCAKKFPEVKPIVGCEMYIAPGGRKNKKGREDEGTRHLILLAKNLTGYHNLIKLCSLARIEGFYYKPRIDHELLEEYHEGLIASSACLAGEIPHLIGALRLEEAEACMLWYKKIFGDDYYLELMRHHTLLTQWPNVMACYQKQKAIEPYIVELAHKHHIKLIATNDVHFVKASDALAHDRLICINTNADINNPKRLRYTQQEFLKTQAEMSALFADIPEAVENTIEVADKVEVYDINRKPILPYFPIPGAYTDPNDYLRDLAYKGAVKRYGTVTPELQNRIDFELKTIRNMGYPDYFLIVRDFIHAARDKGVWVGPGRGSAAGSVVAYCLEITQVDPIKYNLLFERFLNPDRVSLPDIDIDFADDQRSSVLQYVEDKYGKDHVSHVITFGSMAAKSAIRDVARIQGLPLSESDRLCKAIPDALPDKDGQKQKLTLKNIIRYVPEIKEAAESKDPLLSSTIEYAGQLEGSVRNIGVHACAIIISRDPLTEHIPITLATDKETGKDIRVSQYEGSSIESVGMLKMDFLGLKTLSILKKTVENIAKYQHVDLDLDTLPLDDPLTYELFSRGDTVGVFQFESPGMRKWLRELKPTRFEDTIAMTALYRPGPMDYIPNFVDRKNGVKPITYDLPCMEKYLQDTYGVTVYQEQVMLLSQELAGFTKGEADTLRKAMGKKQRETMEQMRVKFLNGGREKGYNPEILNKIWVDWMAFAEYAFNKSHATCYAVLSYQTAYLKAHYPAEFMAAVLSKSLDNYTDIVKFMEECKHMGLTVLGPDINESDHEFTINKKGFLRFGMAGVKGVGYGAVEGIMAEREARGRFKDVYDLVERINLNQINRKTLENLILAGALDSFAPVRRYQYFLAPGSRDVKVLDNLIRYGTKFQEDKNAFAVSLFGSAGENGIPTARPEIPGGEDTTGIDYLEAEKDVVGIYLSAHPLDAFRFEIKHFCNRTLMDCETLLKEAGPKLEFSPVECFVGGMVIDTRAGISKKTGRVWGEFTLQDYTYSMPFRLFGRDYERYMAYTVKGAALLLHCLIQERPIFSAKDQIARNKNLPREKEIRIIGMKLLANAKEEVKSLTLKLYTDSIDAAFRSELLKMLRRNKGKRMELHIVLADRRSKISADFFSRTLYIDFDPALFEWLDRKGIEYSIG